MIQATLDFDTLVARPTRERKPSTAGKPCKYARAAALGFTHHNWRLRTGWHTGTRAYCEPQKAIWELRRLGVTVDKRRITRGVFEYSVPPDSRERCRRIARGLPAVEGKR